MKLRNLMVYLVNFVLNTDVTPWFKPINSGVHLKTVADSK